MDRKTNIKIPCRETYCLHYDLTCGVGSIKEYRFVQAALAAHVGSLLQRKSVRPVGGEIGIETSADRRDQAGISVQVFQKSDLCV